MHPETERLHLYLSGALDPAERRDVEAHLAGCGECAQALAELAAEDEALAGALGLDPAEAAWVESVDLVEPVMAQIACSPRSTPVLVLVAALLSLAGYLGGSLWTYLLDLLPEPGIGSFIALVRSAGPAALRLVLWLGEGGLLATLWPLFVAGAAIGLGYVLTKGEEKRYA